MPLQEIEQFVELLNFFEPLVFKVLHMLQLPRDMERDVDGPGTDGQRRSNVALQRIAHHKQLRGVYMLMLT